MVIGKILSSLFLFSISWANCNAILEDFVQCMSIHSSSKNPVSKYIYTPNSPSYSNLLQSAEQNPRWFASNSKSLKPLFIITPFHESEIQATILCSQKNGLQIRVKSGGHDYEGLSFLCKTPFVIIDLINFRAVSINLDDETAWVQSGATLGELYYAIAQKSQLHGFPGGVCPSVGVGGQFSGGGMGTMIRKFGLASDNIIDTKIADVNGRILDRNAMGKDLFWAIRGGGGASFGVIVSWKIKLVRVPSKVTVFTVPKTLDQDGTRLVHRWQKIAPNLPSDLFLRVIIQNGEGEAKTVVALFNALFLGSKERLVSLMNKKFPELGLKRENCSEMSWIESAQYFAGFPKQVEVLLNRTVQYKSKFKAKSDFVEEPIPESALKEIWKRFPQEQFAYMIMDPFGGKMDEISDSEIPFPHRKRNLYNIQYLVKWEENGIRHMNWIEELFKFMKPYVSNSPRAAYINYRDLDLGINLQENASYSQARIWGQKYFKSNFKRLARVKSKVDPGNFFRSEQSIPLMYIEKR